MTAPLSDALAKLAALGFAIRLSYHPNAGQWTCDVIGPGRAIVRTHEEPAQAAAAVLEALGERVP